MIHPWNTSILSRITKLAFNECLIPYLLSHRHILISVNIRGGQHISLICFIYLRLPLSNSYQLSCSDKVKVSAVFNLVGFRLRLWWVNSILLFFWPGVTKSRGSPRIHFSIYITVSLYVASQTAVWAEISECSVIYLQAFLSRQPAWFRAALM